MTTVCAFRYGNEIAIAADRRVSFGNEMTTDSIQSSKIIPFEGAYLGISGSSRIINIFENDSELRESDLTSMNAIFNSYNMFSDVFEDKYHFDLKDENNGVFHDIGFNSIVINSNGIFSINHGCEINLHETLWSVGTGSEYCIGAMTLFSRTFENLNKNETASSICKASIKISATYDPFTGDEVDVNVINF